MSALRADALLAPPIDPLELYAAGIDTSDYVARVAPLVARAVGPIGDLLDVGAGGGQLGAALREPARRWTAIEPAPAMQRRLRLRPEPPQLIACGWEAAQPRRHGHGTVLAANMVGPLSAPSRFLAACRAWASRTIVWVVPAQNGPRGLCLAGCLPPEWHGEDETPGVEIVLAGLAAYERPRLAGQVDWTFSLVVPDVPRIAAYLADRLAWSAADPRRLALEERLRSAAVPVAGGFRLDVPRRSAILVWSFT